MPRVKFTVEGLKKLKPPSAPKQTTYFDTQLRGLTLRVSWGGAKQFRVMYYTKAPDKKTGKLRTVARSIPLGRTDHLSLDDARTAARKFLADPKQGLKDAASGNFKSVAEDFYRRHVEAHNLRSAHEIKRCLLRYVYPKWEALTLSQIKRGDVTKLLDAVEDKSGPRQADMVLAIVAKIMRWHQARVDDYVPPLAPGMRRYRARPRERILDDQEIQAAWKACDKIPNFGPLVKVLLLTGQRREKVGTMRHADLIDGTWIIHSEDEREKAHARSLKLPRAVLDIIEAQPIVLGNPYVFPGSLRGKRRGCKKPDGPPAFNSWSQRKRELDAKIQKSIPNLNPWRLHDLRRTARSLMARANVRPDIAERTLGHAIPGIARVYDRHHYAAEKADALEKLSTLVATIIDPPKENIVSIARARRKKLSQR